MAITPIYCPNFSKLPHISHGFTTRQGGISTGHFSSLNAALEKEDPQENVSENRKRIALALGAHPNNLITVRQKHSDVVVFVDSSFPHTQRPNGDAIVTKTPGLLIGVITADCTPILLADPHTNIVAAIHAGWRGASTGIIENTIKTMIENGANLSSLMAAIGPCIWQESYEINNATKSQILSQNPNTEAHFIPSSQENHWLFDLPAFIHEKLKKQGVEKISPSPANTYNEEEYFFSYRRMTHKNEPVYGCFFSGIMIKDS